MAKSESVFLTYVRYVLRRWTGLQLAIDHGMGGPFGRQKEVWLGDEIENYFNGYDNVEPNDVEEFLTDILNTEFNAEFEDGSSMEISRHFCRAFSLSKTNPNAEVFQHMSVSDDTIQSIKSSSLRETNANNEVRADAVPRHRLMCDLSSSASVTIENNLEQDMKALTVNGEHEQELSDGWITIAKGKKKK